MPHCSRASVCPFCHYVEDTAVRHVLRDDTLAVVCRSCGAQGPSVPNRGDDAMQHAVEVWNRRGIAALRAETKIGYRRPGPLDDTLGDVGILIQALVGDQMVLVCRQIAGYPRPLDDIHAVLAAFHPYMQRGGFGVGLLSYYDDMLRRHGHCVPAGLSQEARAQWGEDTLSVLALIHTRHLVVFEAIPAATPGWLHGNSVNRVRFADAGTPQADLAVPAEALVRYRLSHSVIFGKEV